MGKGDRKRGRPGINPYIRSLIAIRAQQERVKPQTERMPVKVLAFEIQKEINQQTNEKPPALSTLEKLISEYSHKSSTEDGPWSIDTLDKNPIPPEALPKVLEAYKQHKDGEPLTIREAKWIARLSATQHGDLAYHIARSELLYELLGETPNFDIFDKLLAGLPGRSDHWHVPFTASFSLAGILKNDPTKNRQEKRREKRKGGTK
jgi:hypothetical protein